MKSLFLQPRMSFSEIDIKEATMASQIKVNGVDRTAGQIKRPPKNGGRRFVMGWNLRAAAKRSTSSPFAGCGPITDARYETPIREA